MILRKLDERVGPCYLDFLAARNYPEQEPAYKYARWYHFLAFLIPVLGIWIFIEWIEETARKK